MMCRWARTLPLYGLCLLVLAEVWPPQALDPGAHDRLMHALLWFATLTQNCAWPMRTDWFGVSWPLCLEEWFYLVFSAALLGLGAMLGRRLVLGLFPLVLGDLALGWSATIHSDSGIVLPCLDGVVYGVPAAWLSLHARAVMRNPRTCLAGGLTLLVLLLAGTVSPLIYALGAWSNTLTLVILSLGFALCLAAAVEIASAPACLRRPVEALSGQSYGIYFLLPEHPGVGELRIEAGARGLAAAVRGGILIRVVWGFSFLSLRLLEQPIVARIWRSYAARTARPRIRSWASSSLMQRPWVFAPPPPGSAGLLYVPDI